MGIVYLVYAARLVLMAHIWLEKMANYSEHYFTMCIQYFIILI